MCSFTTIKLKSSVKPFISITSSKPLDVIRVLDDPALLGDLLLISSLVMTL